ncbi:MAG: 16S rRNA (uracil(1498)-N(3))-methyltransferase [Elusimicrobiales bacterium]|nr:16S rRNA (uracil(1498)-N(3))-methyltransferase [Elusimicrobiales bacterium]
MPQYYIPSERIRAGEFAAGPDESNHIARAARARVGDEIEIFDGKGGRYLAVVKSLAGGLVTGSVKGPLPSPEYKTRLTLCFAVVAKPALEDILEHCTEAGVDVFQPVMASRVQFDLFSDWERRAARLAQVVLAAAKQCGRGLLPEVRKPEKFDDLLAAGGAAVLASADGEGPDEAVKKLAGVREIKLFVGPEGGFTKGELEFARAGGAGTMNLGLYTLRAESACLAASSALLTRLG